MSWWRVSLDLPEPLAEALAWTLASATGVATEVQDDTTMTRSDAGTSRVVVGLEAPPDDGFLGALAEALGALGLSDVPIHTRREDDEGWKTGWRAFFAGARVSERIWIRPPWEAAAADAAHTVVEPGLAFGTGTHETTRGVLRVLDRYLAAHPGTPLVDVGAGSGVLSIAAAHLGSRALGVEIDPVALSNARRNLELNGVGDRVELRCGSASAVEGRHPLVVANILARILIEIAPEVAAIAARDLILSGLLAADVEPVRAAYGAFELVERTDEGEWAILHLVRAAR